MTETESLRQQLAELRSVLATWHDIHGTENASEVADALKRVRLQRDEARAERDRLAATFRRYESWVRRHAPVPFDSMPDSLNEEVAEALAEKGTTDGN